MDNANSIVRMQHIRKAFSGVTVLDDVSFDVRRGEVHALAGGNGAGKSTLMKILQGVYSLDSGTVEIAGESHSSLTIDEARKAGICMVFQEFSLIPTMSVAENIFMGSEMLGRGRFLDKKAMLDRSGEILGRLGMDLDPEAEVGTLPTGYWQLTEIAKALRSDARVLILDEPTASLSAAETERFFALIRRLKEQDISLIYISHRMDEIRKIADRITILRNGRNLITSPIADITDEQIVEGIVGRHTEMSVRRASRPSPSHGASAGDVVGDSATGSVGDFVAGSAAEEVKDAEEAGKVVEAGDAPLLQVDAISTAHGVDHVSFSVRRGEVVGLAGLMGSGRTEVTRALFGIDRITSGHIVLNGHEYRPRRPLDAMEDGVALVPEDRREQGLVVSHSVATNLTLTRLRECLTSGLLSKSKTDAMAGALIERYAIKVDDAASPVARLSGGNQQKIVIAKWLGRNPDLLIMDEPTAGVDIGTKAEVLNQVSRFADEGKAVLFISSELAEMVAVCDRYVVMKHGRVVGELDAEGINSEADLQLAIQHADAPAHGADPEDSWRRGTAAHPAGQTPVGGRHGASRRPDEPVGRTQAVQEQEES